MSDIYQAFFVALFTYLKIWGTLIFKKKNLWENTAQDLFVYCRTIWNH